MSLTRLSEKPLAANELERRIKSVTDEILRICKPSKIILFGSGADGTAKPSSDLDFAVIFSSKEDRRSAKEIYKISAKVGFPIDFLLFDEISFNEKLELGGVCELIKAEGRELFVRER